MKTPHLLLITCPVLAVLALAPPVPVLSPLLGLAAVVTVGELWLRALVREALTPVARLGLAVVAGLISLPLVAMVLQAMAVRIEGRGLAAGLAVLATVLAAVGWKRADVTQGVPADQGRDPADPAHPGRGVGPDKHRGTTKTRGPSTTRRLSTTVAVGVPAVLALVIGGTATAAYQKLPHPPEPGFTSLALAGWAAGIDHPIAIGRHGLQVPLEVTSAGEPTRSAILQVRIGDKPAGPATPIQITAGTRPLRVHIPAPADGCLHPIRISVGAASTIFYGRGPFPC